MSNYDRNFEFFNLQCGVQQFPINYEHFLWNYQQFQTQPYFWTDQNLTAQNFQNFLLYAYPQTLAPENYNGWSSKAFVPYLLSEDNYLQTQTQIPNMYKSMKSQEVLVQTVQNNENSNASNDSSQQKLKYMRLNSKIGNTISQELEQIKKQLNQSFTNNDKKMIQSLRYQRKNIEANIVNKIYTYLKTSLKNGLIMFQNNPKDKQKAVNFYRLLQKLQKAKKQSIKREFLKSLIKMDESLNGYSKICKQLSKKNIKAQQFEYYVRVIIKNYLRVNSRNSILTSRKMNPSLWKDHLSKVRELDNYLFSHQNIQSQE